MIFGDVVSNPSSNPHGFLRNRYSSSSYRAQAETLMAQIKQSMKSQKPTIPGGIEVKSQQDGRQKVLSSGGESAIVSLHSSSSNMGNPRHSPLEFFKLTSISSHQGTCSQPSVSPCSVAPSSQHDLDDGMLRLSISEQPLLRHAVNVVHEQSLSLPTPVLSGVSVRARQTESNRLASSSTVGGTTATTGSAQSFVKHSGPAHIHTICPQDLPALPDRFGDMIFDKANSRWVRNPGNPVPGTEDEPSEDPFMDIESLRDDARAEQEVDESEDSQDDDTVRQGHYVNEMTRIEERSELDDEEVDLMSFSTDASSHVVGVMAGAVSNAAEDGVETTDSEDNVELVQPEARPLEFDSEDEYFHYLDVPKVTVAQEPNIPSSDLALPAYPSPHTTPRRIRGAAQVTPVIRSVLKSNAITPASVLKDPTRSKYLTPLQQGGSRRSVSFSDGKLEGPIQGLCDSGNSTTSPFSLDGSGLAVENHAELSPSARSKRIEEMMHALEDTGM